MRHDVDDLLAHQRRETHRTTRIIGEGQERAAIGNEAAMQGKAVHRRRHAMFADAVMDIAAGETLRCDVAHARRNGQVRVGQVSRTADRQIGCIVDDAKHHFRSLACRDLGCLFDMFAAECAKLFKQARRQLLQNGLPEVVPDAVMPPFVHTIRVARRLHDGRHHARSR